MALLSNIVIRGGGDSQTSEPLVFAVDYDDAGGGSVADTSDIPANLVFTTQAQINNLLSGGSFTAFKNIMDVWDHLPPLIAHAVTINIVSGKQRPRSGDTVHAWDFSGKVMVAEGYIEFVGASPSSWTALVGLGSLTVDSFTAATSTDPRMEFGTTQTLPFASLDLRGLPVVLNTGQVIMTHDHDDDTLIVCENASPAPSTASVARPSTIPVNSLNDTTALASLAAIRIDVGGSRNSPGGAHIDFRNLLVDPFGKFGVQPINGSVFSWDQCLVDYSIAVINDQRAIQLTDIGTEILMRQSGIKSTPGAGGADEPLVLLDGAKASIEGSVFYGTRDGLTTFDCPSFIMIHSVIRDCGDLTGFGLQLNDTVYFFADRSFFLQGANARIDGQPLQILGSLSHPLFNFLQRVAVGGVGAVPAVTVSEGAEVDFSGAFFSSEGFQQGVAANGGVGLEIPAASIRSTAFLNSANNVTGSSGDLRFAGAVSTYANLVSVGPFTDLSFNLLEKV